jgi:hypothetical protein
MNEQIRELTKQAEIKFEAHPQHLGIVTAVITPADLERFAELIVRECIAQCEQVATTSDAKSKSKFVTDDGRMLHEGMWGGAKNCSGQIKQHFGVES